MERTPRNPPDLEIPAFLEIYDPPRPVAPREPREHLTRGEREASKVLLALLLCLNAINLLLLFGVEQLRPAVMALTVATTAIAVVLFLNLQSAGVSERLFYLESRPPLTRTGRLIVILVVLLVLAALYVLVLPLENGLDGPFHHLYLLGSFIGGAVLIESNRSVAFQRHEPVPTHSTYTPRRIPRSHVVIFTTIGLVMFIPSALLLVSGPSIASPEPLTDAAQWIADSLRSVEMPGSFSTFEGAIVLPRWLAASLVTSINIAVLATISRNLKVTPASDSPPVSAPNSGRSPNNLVSYLAGAAVVAGVVIFLIASS